MAPFPFTIPSFLVVLLAFAVVASLTENTFSAVCISGTSLLLLFPFQGIRQMVGRLRSRFSAEKSVSPAPMATPRYAFRYGSTGPTSSVSPYYVNVGYDEGVNT